MYLPPVHIAILAFRGARTLATAIGKPYQRVQEWARPYASGGNDGEFPNPVIVREVYKAAKARGVEIDPMDLFFGKEASAAEAAQLMESMPPQSRAAWWPLAPAHGREPEPDAVPGR